jgi:hypothetical protein
VVVGAALSLIVQAGLGLGEHLPTTDSFPETFFVDPRGRIVGEHVMGR